MMLTQIPTYSDLSEEKFPDTISQLYLPIVNTKGDQLKDPPIQVALHSSLIFPNNHILIFCECVCGGGWILLFSSFIRM